MIWEKEFREDGEELYNTCIDLIEITDFSFLYHI